MTDPNAPKITTTDGQIDNGIYQRSDGQWRRIVAVPVAVDEIVFGPTVQRKVNGVMCRLKFIGRPLAGLE